MYSNSVETQHGDAQRERVLRLLSLVTFFIFFQAYMVAPIIPRLAQVFGVSPQQVGLIVPAYLIPYGVATLVCGLLADRLGLWRLMAASLVAFAVLTALTATARSVEELAFWRSLTGIGASGVVPLALVFVGRLYPFEKRGRPLGWIFGAMAGGMAFGAPFGTVLEPYLGWRALFVSVGVIGAVMLSLLMPHRQLIADALQATGGSFRGLVLGYRDLLSTRRGARTYAYVFLNSMFHSGVFTWLGVYLEHRYGLGPVGIGLALLGYGIPGFIFGPLIGRAADRYGRGRLIPLGLALGALSAAALMADMPLIAIPLAVAVLSFGYDMTQPLFAGIVTTLGGQRPGQAMGLNVFMLFVGFGLGSLVFGEVLRLGFAPALAAFAGVELVIALFALALFRAEMPVRAAVGQATKPT